MMTPRYTTMQLPERGFQWLPGEDLQGECDPVPADAWLRQHGKTLDIFVQTQGPSGSGRYWTVTIGVAAGLTKRPVRGFCFQASTAGWRTLQRFGASPLQWIRKGRDGAPELVFWDSFPVTAESSSVAESGLVAWIFTLHSKGGFAIDWSESREQAEELAASYRVPLPGQASIQALRNAAARDLTEFATGACSAEEKDGATQP